MGTFMQILGFVAMAAVAVVLVLGLWNLAKGGSANTSQRLMRMRVMLQAVAVVFLMGFLWVQSR